MRDLNDLNLFAAVVEHEGFSAAGRALGLPKSRISRRVAELEAQLGVRLLERSTRRFRVTDVGRDVYRHARAALYEAAAIDDVVLRLKAEPQGLVRISCPTGAERLFATTLPAFLARHPKLRVQMIVSNRRIDLIEEGVDVAIRVRETLDSNPDLQVKIISNLGSMLVASPGLIAALGEPRSPGDVARFPTLSQTDASSLDRWTVRNSEGAEQVILHEPRLSASSFQLLKQAATEGLGIARLPEFSCRDALDSGELVRVLPQWSTPEGILHLVFTSRRGQLPSVRAVIDFAAEVLHPRSAAWTAGA
jgi:DNA-binding transcriptional LysR family regulator